MSASEFSSKPKSTPDEGELNGSEMPGISNHRKAYALLALILALVLWFSIYLRQPSYHGKSVKQWSKVLWAGSPAEQAEAAEAINEMGTNAIPDLERMLRSKDSAFRQSFLGLCEKQSFVRYPCMDYDIDYQRIALKSVAALGETARPMVPLLHELIKDWRNQSLDVVYEATRIASKFEPHTTPMLVFGDSGPRLMLPGAASIR